MFCGRLSEVGTKYRKNISPHKIFQHFPTTMDTGHRSEYLALPSKYLNICSTQTKDNPHSSDTLFAATSLCWLVLVRSGGGHSQGEQFTI